MNEKSIKKPHNIIAMALIVLVIILTFTGCSDVSSRNDKNNNFKINYSEAHHIILDTDTAGDDALAIVMLAKAPNIKLEGVTVLAGNVDIEQAANNALMSLEVAGRGDIPVHKGANSSIDKVEKPCYSVFGNDGMGDAGLVHPSKGAEKKNAVDYIIETVKNIQMI